MTTQEEVNAIRDTRARRRLLEILDSAKVGPRGGMGGRMLRNMVDQTSPSSDRFEDDEHAIRLLRDLKAADLVKETDERTKKDQRFSLDFLFYEITSLGSSLRHGLIPNHPMVEDDRR